MRRTTKRLRTLAGIALAGTLILTGCGDPSGGGGDEGDGPIVIGSTQSMTGPLGSFGPMLTAGYELAVKQINDAGGIDVDGTKRKVELVTLDNQSDPSLATTQARKLILDQGAVALVGPCTPPISIPVAQVAEKEKVPMVGTCLPVGAFEAGSDAGWTYAWDLFFSETDQAATAFEAFDKIPGSNKKVAIFTDTEPDGIIERELYKKAAAAAGYEVVGDYSFPVGTTDYSSFVTDAKAKGAQFVIAQVIPPDGFALWKTMKALGLNPLGAFCAKAATGAAWLTLEAVGEGTLTETFWSPTAGFPEADELHKELSAQLKTTGDQSIAVATYSVMQVLADAIERAGSTDAAKINEEIGKTDDTYPIGPVKFNDKNFAVTPHYGAQWVGGDIVQVTKEGAVPVVSPVAGLAG